ncbi:MAG: hypothetical protein JW704_09975, partial [Anaerolineaceae bacterium]|nr:hypothetical protein [Anaerolineaceae bacterium]
CACGRPKWVSHVPVGMVPISQQLPICFSFINIWDAAGFYKKKSMSCMATFPIESPLIAAWCSPLRFLAAPGSPGICPSPKPLVVW